MLEPNLHHRVHYFGPSLSMYNKSGSGSVEKPSKGSPPVSHAYSSSHLHGARSHAQSHSHAHAHAHAPAHAHSTSSTYYPPPPPSHSLSHSLSHSHSHSHSQSHSHPHPHNANVSARHHTTTVRHNNNNNVNHSDSAHRVNINNIDRDKTHGATKKPNTILVHAQNKIAPHISRGRLILYSVVVMFIIFLLFQLFILLNASSHISNNNNNNNNNNNKGGMSVRGKINEISSSSVNEREEQHDHGSTVENEVYDGGSIQQEDPLADDEVVAPDPASVRSRLSSLVSDNNNDDTAASSSPTPTPESAEKNKAKKATTTPSKSKSPTPTSKTKSKTAATTVAAKTKTKSTTSTTKKPTTTKSKTSVKPTPTSSTKAKEKTKTKTSTSSTKSTAQKDKDNKSKKEKSKDTTKDGKGKKKSSSAPVARVHLSESELEDIKQRKIRGAKRAQAIIDNTKNNDHSNKDNNSKTKTNAKSFPVFRRHNIDRAFSLAYTSSKLTSTSGGGDDSTSIGDGDTEPVLMPYSEEERSVLTKKEMLNEVISVPAVVATVHSPDDSVQLEVLLDGSGRIGFSVSGLSLSSSSSISPLLLPSLVELSVDGIPACVFAVDSKMLTAQVHAVFAKGRSYWRPEPGAERAEYEAEYTEITLWCEGSGCASSSSSSSQIQFRVFNGAIAVRALVRPSTSSQLHTPVPAGVTVSEEDQEVAAVSFQASIVLPVQTSVTGSDNSSNNDDSGEVVQLSSLCTANTMEEPYARVECTKMREALMLPLTITVTHGDNNADANKKVSPEALDARTRYISVLQANGPSFIGTTVSSSASSAASSSSSSSTVLLVSTRGDALVVPKTEDDIGVTEAVVHDDGEEEDDSDDSKKKKTKKKKPLVTTTSWHVVVFAPDLSLLHFWSTTVVPLLCPPPSSSPSPLSSLSSSVSSSSVFSDSRWVPFGKSLRVRSFSSVEAFGWIDYAVRHSYQLVHFDAGWYGDEYSKTSKATEILSDFKNKLDMRAVCEYATERGVAVSVYVNELALRDTDKLVSIYPAWGLRGVKFGFVEYDSPHDMRVLHHRINAFGRVGMMVNVHDAYRPRGLTRSYPHLVTQEGVRGEERAPSATHHTLLPFVRLLAGSADYTPRYLNGAGGRCTHAHQLALPIVLYSPVQSLFWAEPLEAVEQASKKYFTELKVWDVLPTTWQDTRVIMAKMGEYVSIGRRSGDHWFIGTITNTAARKLTLDVEVLFRDIDGHPMIPRPELENSENNDGDDDGANQDGYYVDVYKDSHWKGRTDPFTVKVAPVRTYWLRPYLLESDIRRADYKPVPPPKSGVQLMQGTKFNIEMAPSGGHVMHIYPVRLSNAKSNATSPIVISSI